MYRSCILLNSELIQNQHAIETLPQYIKFIRNILLLQILEAKQ